jgi:predicted DNA-binding transcriptional regulator YafY
LLLALRESHKVTFLYEKFNDEPISTRTVQPLALKEFESRWYLLARSLSDQSVKIFALDRMQQLETAAAHFPKQAAFDVKAYFEHSFGISRPSDKTAEPEIVVLQFGNNYGKYIKSLPLHHSQQIVDESSNTVTISVQVYLTPDFVNQLLSHGEQLKVLSPKILQDQMKEILLRAAQQY